MIVFGYAIARAAPLFAAQLQYSIAVADLVGFGRAAERSHVSQPSLSAQIAIVEHALGVRLFERDRRSVRVSTAGAAVIDGARQVLVTARDLVDAARRQADPFRGTIRIGVPPTVCPYLLPEITPPLCEDGHCLRDQTLAICSHVGANLALVWRRGSALKATLEAVGGTLRTALSRVRASAKAGR